MQEMASNRVIQASRRRFHQFLENDASGGILLIVHTIIALLWANSAFHYSYEHLWHTEIALKIGSFEVGMHLLHWVNDGLMAIFFFVVGLEIKREVIAGELSSMRKAALPALGALGGMVLPALVFSALTFGKDGSQGWGIPMATDIAFSLGILSLLGKRVPLSLKVFLVALAIVDDLGAIMVIAIFYSSNLQLEYLIQALALISLLLIINWMKVRKPWVYVVIGTIVWYFFLKSGIHATIAGVLVAFTVPVRRNLMTNEFNDHVDKFNLCDDCATSYTLPDQEIHKLDNLKRQIKMVQSPAQRIEHMLHKLVNYFIMPAFALGNAGVVLDGSNMGPYGYLSLSVALALFVGKALGITLLSWGGVKLGLAELPQNIKWSHMFGVAILGGLGFTMSLFISNLAYFDLSMLNAAKLGVLGGSLVAGVVGYLLLSKILPRPKNEEFSYPVES